MRRLAAGLVFVAACAVQPPAPPSVAAAVAPDLSPGTAAPVASGLLTPETAPPREDPPREDPACAAPPDHPAFIDVVDARAAFAAFFDVDPKDVQPGWFAAQATPWLPRVAGVTAGRIGAGRIGDGTPASIGVLVLGWCADRPGRVCYDASLRLRGHDRIVLSALVDLRGAPGAIPLSPRAPVFTTPDGGCTRMPALVVVASGHDEDGDHESVALISLAGDGRVLHRDTVTRYPDGGSSLVGLALVQGLPDQPLDLDVTVQSHLRRGSRCLRPDPVTTRHRLENGRYTELQGAQLRSGCA